MEELSLRFLPFPHVFRDERRDGLNMSWPERCMSCDRQCERLKADGVQLCSYGLNYLRVDDELLIAGVIARDYSTSNGAFRRMRRKIGKHSTTLRELEAVMRAKQLEEADLRADLERRKIAVIEEYRRSQSYKADVIDGLRPDLQRALSQVHDYRQLITQIVQNVNVLLEADHPGERVEDSLKKSSHELRAIYWAARLMESKLEAALYLMYPERISDPKHQEFFRLHGLITKYVKIYQRSLDDRGLTVRWTGLSYGSLFANPDAVGVIPHTFLDNAVKYAPRGSTVELNFSEGKEAITFDVTSSGPRITSSERSRIFDLFFRGQGAVACVAEGTGFGLGLAQHVAELIGASLSVRQAAEPGIDGFYRTTFSAHFPKNYKPEMSDEIRFSRH